MLLHVTLSQSSSFYLHYLNLVHFYNINQELLDTYPESIFLGGRCSGGAFGSLSDLRDSPSLEHPHSNASIGSWGPQSLHPQLRSELRLQHSNMSTEV